MSADEGARRPAPQYGQYATPEELAEARGISLEQLRQETAARSAQAQAPRPDSPADGTAPPPYSASPPPATPAGVNGPGATFASAGASPSPRRMRLGDVITTVILLGIGLVTVLFSLPGFTSFGEAIQYSFDEQGLGSYSSVELADTLGVVAIVASLLLWLGSLWGSVALMRRGRSAWWVPVVGAVLWFLVVVAIFVTAVVGDPAFLEYVNQQGASLP